MVRLNGLRFHLCISRIATEAGLVEFTDWTIETSRVIDDSVFRVPSRRPAFVPHRALLAFLGCIAMASPSATFGQKCQLPVRPWLRIWIVTALLLVNSLGSLEAYWHHAGFRPTVTDSKELWYFWRHRVYRDDGKVLVFLGTSRILADISIAALHERLPEYRIVQLGLSGSVSSIGILNDLTTDPAFTGTVVCELDTPLLDRSLWDGHREFSDFRPPSGMQFGESLIQARMQDLVAAMGREFTLRQTINRLVYGERLQRPHEIRRTFDRETQWDFSRVGDLERFRLNAMAAYQDAYQRFRFSAWSSLRSSVIELNTGVEALRARRGNVVFLRAPSSAERLALEERYHPKNEQWDRFAASTNAICLHFRDIPEMRNASCPDGSHLAADDASAFTHALIKELQHRRVLGQTEGKDTRVKRR